MWSGVVTLSRVIRGQMQLETSNDSFSRISMCIDRRYATADTIFASGCPYFFSLFLILTLIRCMLRKHVAVLRNSAKQSLHDDFFCELGSQIRESPAESTRIQRPIGSLLSRDTLRAYVVWCSHRRVVLGHFERSRRKLFQTAEFKKATTTTLTK